MVIEGTTYVLDAMVPSGTGRRDEVDDFQFKDIRIGRATIFTTAEILHLYDKGSVRLLSPTERLSDRCPRRESASPDDPKGDARAEMAIAKGYRRLRYLKAYDSAPVPLSTARLSNFIASVAEEIGDAKPPSPGSVRRWITKRGALGVRRLGEMVGRNPSGAQGSRLQPRVQEILGEVAERYYESIRVQVRDVWVIVTHRVNDENAARGIGDELLRRPAESTVWRWLKTNLNFERAKRRWGVQEATRRFGVVQGSMVADALLDIAIIDHTILDCWVIDDVTQQPIGRPRLTVILDSCSRMVLGFDVSWANAGLDAAFAALRHAVRPKKYVQSRYPQITHDWLAYGQPRTLVVDQGLEFMGTTFEDTCLNLGISLEPAPARTPEYKGQIERFFGSMNKGLLHKLPGSVPLKPHQLREFGIDPSKTAVLFLSDLIEIIHLWIVTVYSREVHSEIGKAPAKAWADRAATDVIELCPNLEELDQACARTKTVRLTREGIRMHRNLIYRCNELAALREDIAKSAPSRSQSKQGSVSVKVTYHADDVSRIYVWNPRTNTSVEVPCVMAEYTRGLSEHLHHRILEFTDKANREFQTEAEMCANRTAVYRLMDEICETRVVDRKRLQRVREPERRAQQDLVRLDAINGQGGTVASKVVQVDIDPIRNRDPQAPREKHPLLRSASRKRKTGIEKNPANRVTAVTETSRIPAPGSDDFDWALAIERRRQKRDGE